MRGGSESQENLRIDRKRYSEVTILLDLIRQGNHQVQAEVLYLQKMLEKYHKLKIFFRF